MSGATVSHRPPRVKSSEEVKKKKEFKMNKTVLTIVIGLEMTLCWNLVKSALDKEDSSVPVYPPFIIIISNFSV